MKHITRIFVGFGLLLAGVLGGTTVQSIENGPAYLVIKFDVRAERLEEFTSLMMGVKQAMKTEEGFEDAFVLRGMEAPHQFVLIERWESKALHQEHFDRIVASGDWRNIRAMLNKEPMMQYTTLLAN